MRSVRDIVDALPWMGLGLSSNLEAAEQPNPYRLCDRAPGLCDYVEYSAPLDIEEARREASLFEEMWARRSELPVLFHPVHLNLYGPELESSGSLTKLADHAREVESPWVSNDVAWWHREGEPFPGYLYLPPPLSLEGLADCVWHAQHVASHLDRPLLLENPTLLTARGSMHVLDFMAELSERSGCPLLIDLGHLWSFQLSRGLALDAGFADFPWERVVELHMAGGVLTRLGGRAFFVDDHTQPVREELFELLGSILPRCTGLRAVTFEGDGHPEAQAERTLRRLRPLIEANRSLETTTSEAERVPPPAAGLPRADPRRAWDAYRAAFHGQAEDSVGAEVEADLRLAVLAQVLDRRWPLTRLILAGDGERLARFAGSTELEQVYREGGTVAQAFGTFARRESLKKRSAELAAVLAFEVWANGLALGSERNGSGRRRVAGWRWGSFPMDLSELLFCAQALRRHLGARAWATGRADLSALEALSQAARRARNQRWSVAVRVLRGRLEVVPLSAPLEALLSRVERLGPDEDLEDEWALSWAEALRLGLVANRPGIAPERALE